MNQTLIANTPTIKRWSRPTLAAGVLPHARPCGSYQSPRNRQLCAKRPKTNGMLADANRPFDGPVIPFQDVIEILRRSKSAVLLQRVGSAAKFEFRPI